MYSCALDLARKNRQWDWQDSFGSPERNEWPDGADNATRALSRREEKETEKLDCRRKDEDVPKTKVSAERNDLMKSHLTRILRSLAWVRWMRYSESPHLLANDSTFQLSVKIFSSNHTNASTEIKSLNHLVFWPCAKHVSLFHAILYAIPWHFYFHFQYEGSASPRNCLL